MMRVHCVALLLPLFGCSFFLIKRRLSFNTKSFNVIQTPIFIERKSNKFENAIDSIEFSVSAATSMKFVFRPFLLKLIVK